MTKIGPSQEFDFFVTLSRNHRSVEVWPRWKFFHRPPPRAHGLMCIRHLKVVSYQPPEGRLSGGISGCQVMSSIPMDHTHPCLPCKNPSVSSSISWQITDHTIGLSMFMLSNFMANHWSYPVFIHMLMIFEEANNTISIVWPNKIPARWFAMQMLIWCSMAE